MLKMMEKKIMIKVSWSTEQLDIDLIVCSVGHESQLLLNQ